MNEKNRLLVLRLVLLLVCTTQVLIGLGIMIGNAGILEFFAQSYGANRVPTEPEFLYILKPLGAYMVTIGFLAGAAFLDPQRCKIAIDGVVFLLVLRVLQRFVFGGQAQQAFGISTSQLVFQSLFFLAIAVALLFFRPRKATETGTPPVSPGATG